MRIVKPSVTLFHATPDPLRVLERAGRVCYQSQHKVKACVMCDGSGLTEFWGRPCCICRGTGSDEDSAREFVRMILTNGHESVLEHVSAGVLIVTDRGVTHELVRHRLAAFSQESTRYCDYTGDRFGGELSFIEPPSLSEAHDDWEKAMLVAESGYARLRAYGVAPQLARSVLPNALKAEITMTCNVREWRHVLKLRLAPAAHPQMREVARMIHQALLEWCPELFADLVAS